ncbi:hypothetical protein [Streptacidiphilus rugosus]|uniref:hypothetical protein n=1 Tax=Streptacidiphilus rugosus TaxID=405783 RepID=UPI000564555C|nr:hypothetical protein [Streptacidiphilus rugosus]
MTGPDRLRADALIVQWIRPRRLVAAGPLVEGVFFLALGVLLTVVLTEAAHRSVHQKASVAAVIGLSTLTAACVTSGVHAVLLAVRTRRRRALQLALGVGLAWASVLAAALSGLLRG